MTDRREEIEQILKKANSLWPMGVLNGVGLTNAAPEHLLQLLALDHPQGSKEALAKILVFHGCYAQRVERDIMAWSRGERETQKQVWCKHWFARESSNCWQRTGTEGNSFNHFADTSWTHCPFCGTPRPQP